MDEFGHFPQNLINISEFMVGKLSMIFRKIVKLKGKLIFSTYSVSGGKCQHIDFVSLIS